MTKPQHQTLLIQLCFAKAFVYLKVEHLSMGSESDVFWSV